MPMIIEPIDKIARQKGRGVLYISFYQNDDLNVDLLSCPDFDWKNCIVRKEVICWLEENHIKWQPCFIVWRDGLIAYPYLCGRTV